MIDYDWNEDYELVINGVAIPDDELREILRLLARQDPRGRALPRLLG